VSTITRGALPAGPSFDVRAGWLPTAQQMDEAGLPGGPLAAVRLDVARISPAGKWHPVSRGTPAAGCPRMRRAAALGRELTRRQAPLLAGLDLCRACAAQIRLHGRAGVYLEVARHVVAAGAWTQALEAAAPSADWQACARWAARTPFSDEKVLTMLGALDGHPDWERARRAATLAWQELWDRADAAQANARLAAGPPALRAHAAAAAAVVAAQQDTVTENELIDAISARPKWWKEPVPARGWGAGSRAWIDILALDADPAAARTALADAVEQLYGTAQVRDVALLPPTPTCPGDEFCSPAAWAHAEYRSVRETVARRWCQRLEAALSEVEADAAEVSARWRLLLIVGWPLTAERDRELAYLGHYPVLGRTPPVVVPSSSPQCPSRSIVLLHVPGFAARHAAAHHSPNFTVTIGPVVPAQSVPSPRQVSAMFRTAAVTYAGRHS